MNYPVSGIIDAPICDMRLNGVPFSAEALVLSEVIHGKRLPGAAPQAIVHIAVNDRQLDMLAAGLAFFAPEIEILRFPAWDCMPYDRASPLASIMASRMQVLAALASPLPTPLPHAGEGSAALRRG